MKFKDLLEKLFREDDCRIKLVDNNAHELFTAPRRSLNLLEYEDREVLSIWSDYDSFHEVCEITVSIRLAVGE